MLYGNMAYYLQRRKRRDLLHHPHLGELSVDELKLRGEDEGDSDIERHIMNLQRERFDEMTREGRDARFGRVYPISREDYTREVTEASKQPEKENSTEGTGIVCFLYKPR
jgi:hypothetical protein